MKGIVSVLAVLSLCGAAFAQSPQVYTPRATDPSVPTFVNAEVVRVDSLARTVTVRADGRESVLAVEGDAVPALVKLAPGDQVMLGYRIDGPAHIVTSFRTVAPPSGASTARVAIESVRVVAMSPSRGTLTIDDPSGTRRIYAVTKEAAGTMRRFHAGDEVVLSYRPGKGTTRTVTRIEAVGIGSATTPTAVTHPAPVVTGTTATTTTTTTVTRTPVVATAPVVTTQPATSVPGGMPVPPNMVGGAAQLQPVPNVGAPVSTVNVALPPATRDALPMQAELDLQAASSVLALKANEIDRQWYGYKDMCLNGTTPAGAGTTTGREWFVLLGPAMQQPTDDGCRQRLVEITRAAEQFQQQMDIARDAARRAEVQPGTMREILQRNRLDR
jgi:hypothetical protein